MIKKMPSEHLPYDVHVVENWFSDLPFVEQAQALHAHFRPECRGIVSVSPDGVSRCAACGGTFQVRLDFPDDMLSVN